ncbi:MAG: cyclopropane-fatty-acyl-phospholipid synthase family protein [Pseudomonadota bacterium]
MQTLLKQMLGHLVQHGNLTVFMPDGSETSYGDGTGKPAGFRIHDQATVLHLLIDPDLYLGEAYTSGQLTVTDGSIYDVLKLLMANLETARTPVPVRIPYAIRKRLKRLQQDNRIGRARNNVAHHYDLSGDLYDLFLDNDRQYSCAYFEKTGQSLEQAQLSKKRHLAAKLVIEPGMKVLDIGSGWGGLGLYLAQVAGAQVKGVTLSEEQHKVSSRRARKAGLDSEVSFDLKDYRELDGKFDRIVSVGMFEHVGVRHYSELFGKVRDLLAPDGVFVLHSIGRAGGPGATSAWIQKYIFPGGYCPALSEVVPEVERSGLYMTDVEILRLHYARTLAEWRKRFQDHRHQAVALYDEEFARMWEFYLASSELSFRYLGLNNFQLQAAGNQHALPLTRDYIASEEGRLRSIEGRVYNRRRPAGRRKQVVKASSAESRHYPQISKQ